MPLFLSPASSDSGTQAQAQFGALADAQQRTQQSSRSSKLLRFVSIPPVESIDIHRDESAFHAHFSPACLR